MVLTEGTQWGLYTCHGPHKGSGTLPRLCEQPEAPAQGPRQHLLAMGGDTVFVQWPQGSRALVHRPRRGTLLGGVLGLMQNLLSKCLSQILKP